MENPNFIFATPFGSPLCSQVPVLLRLLIFKDVHAVYARIVFTIPTENQATFPQLTATVHV